MLSSGVSLTVAHRIVADLDKYSRAMAFIRTVLRVIRRPVFGKVGGGKDPKPVLDHALMGGQMIAASIRFPWNASISVFALPNQALDLKVSFCVRQAKGRVRHSGDDASI